MTTAERTWDDLTHAEHAKQHRANAAAFDRQTICRDGRYASIDPVHEVTRERLAAGVEEALAAAEAGAFTSDKGR